ncbi:MAG TPA: dihydrolipoamide acetyltransferase family protein [Streptosporangiaceae bacterium]|jgi:pyruvate dehydrogenase E2 component (dihydrolipoamide acetyltransferase)
MTPRVFTLPDLGEGLTDADLVRWLVAEGDEVAVDQSIAEVETAKASVELPCPYAGVVAELHGTPGDTINVGAPLITITEPGPAPAHPTSASPEPETVPAQPGSGFQEPGVESSSNVLVGFGPRDHAPASRAARRKRLAVLASGGGERNVAVVSPLVRRLAREHEVDLGALGGSGPDGLVLRRDVEAAIAPTAPERTEDAARRIPLTGIRGRMAEHMARSRREIPEATVWVDVDATEFLAVRDAVNARDPERPVTLLGLLARFCVLGLARHPELNARVDTAAHEVVLEPRVHLGFAAQTDRGLVVPVVHDAHTRTARELSADLRALTARARDGALTPAELTGGTFTVNNYGVFGVDGSAAIINHPEVAIVGIGRIADRPWAVDGTLAVRKVTELTLAFDHRACDGGTAGGFLRYVADCVEHPSTLLADL